MTYQEFLETKIELAQDSGFVVAAGKDQSGAKAASEGCRGLGT